MTQLAGSRFDRESQTWRVPLSWQACIALRSLFGDTLTIGPDLTEWAYAERERKILPAMAMRDAIEPDPSPVWTYIDEVEKGSSLKLFPYQRVDAEFMATVGQLILANEPGLGKTGATIRAVQLMCKLGMDPLPVLVICPNSLKFTVWQEGFALWAPELKVTVIDGSAGKRRKQLLEPSDVYVINWESVRLHSRLAPYGQIQLTDAEKAIKELNELDLRTVIMDEAHRLKDPAAKQTRAAWAVAHGAVYRFALTGTPVTKNVGDLWALLHAVHPRGFPAKTKFINRYAQTTFNFFGGMEITGINPGTRDELFKMVDPLLRRVPKQAALPQLPEKLPVQYRHTPMTPKQQKAYDQMAEGMMASLNELLVAPNPLSQLTRLAQFAAAAAEVEPDQYGPDGELVQRGRVKLVAPSSKVDDLVDLLEEMGDAPLVVGAVSRQLVELAAKKLESLNISHGLITGAQSSAERAKIVTAFQAGHIRVVLLTLGAGAEGITLTRADTFLFMQESWSEVQNLQAQDRVHRIGSEGHKAIRIIVQITPNSIEERKISVLADKREQMQEVVRDAATLKKLLGG